MSQASRAIITALTVAIIGGSAALLAAIGGGSAASAQTTGPAVRIAPHRALYNLSLAHARSGSEVSDVRGQMMFEWSDGCDGWTVDQRFRLEFSYAQGDQLNMTTTYSTWEAKSGLEYRFIVRKLTNGQLEEEVRGHAQLEKIEGPGTVYFSHPKKIDLPLKAGTLFPARHTLDLIERARTGEHLFLRRVFDGADAGGATEINAVIGAGTTAGKGHGDEPLLSGPAWPVRLAFFQLDEESSEQPVAPDYELSMLLLDNGVAESMVIDYGDFAINVHLDRIEALPTAGCR